jgi:hypothetical protein
MLKTRRIEPSSLSMLPAELNALGMYCQSWRE